MQFYNFIYCLHMINVCYSGFTINHLQALQRDNFENICSASKRKRKRHKVEKVHGSDEISSRTSCPFLLLSK